jgi:[protein-PII] uridylyltransferase
MQLIFADQEKNKAASSSRRELMDRTESGENILRLFEEACEEGYIVDIELVRTLDEHPEMVFTSKECRQIFDGILRSRQHVFATISRMHEMRILGKILPEFAGISQFFQHNIYHFFTADEHTLRTIRSCEYLDGANEHASRVLKEIKDRSVLYYALLLHDIAKPLDLQRHEVVGAEMVPGILRRFSRLDCVDDVTFLVREHLRMEQIAFRRNFREESTLAPFVQSVASLERLNLLYILTYADMAALNPGVLTEWKKVLLSELYEAARELLLHGKSETERTSAALSLVEPVSSMDHHFFQTALQDIIDGELMRMHVTHHRAYSEVSIFCVDRPQLLSQLSAAFFGADTSIVDAAIETRNDVVIDLFRVVDIISGKHMSQQQTLELRKLVRSVCAGEINVESLYEAHKRKWIRRLKKLPQSNIKTAVEYIPHVSTEGRRQTIVEVYAPDTFGLLYRLSAEISLFGLNVAFAKIASRVDGVVDSFYVTDREGKPLEDVRQQEELRTRILRQITEPVR